MLNFREFASFITIGLLPVTCLTLSTQYHGPWPFITVTLIAIVVPLLDILFGSEESVAAPNVTTRALPYVLFASHIILLPLGAWSLAQEMPNLLRIALFLSLGLFFGTISMANGHELIHRSDRLSFNFGRIIFITLLFGHHVSAHLLIHHRFAGTSKDPSTARMGQSLYRFMLRAWLRSFAKGYRAENMRRYNAGRLYTVHPYTYYVGGALGMCLGVFLWLGTYGLLAYIALSAFAASQLLLVDYVQHYGLHRRTNAKGKIEKMDLHHSWNAPFFWSTRMTLNAPNHSDHHTNPSKPYYELSTKGSMPMLPYPISVMGICALVPPIWFRLMDHRAKEWRL